MTKSDFRATKSLAADLMRIEESIIKNESQVVSSVSQIKNMIPSLENLSINAIEFRDTVSGINSTLKDKFDVLEDDMTSLDGMDLFEFKTSPDDVIINLRKASDNVTNLDYRIEDCVKLIVKSKGNKQFQDEINSATEEVQKLLKTLDDLSIEISSSLKMLMGEIKHFKAHSKDLLQHKIL